ncbi:MAG: hypothetical protein ACM3Q4_03620 [Acidobacteriota bacterium]
MKRRDLLYAGAAGLAGLASQRLAAFEQTPGTREPGEGKIPLIHITDLYHPPQDPDDHIDLATIAALGEFDLKAVILDVTGKFLHAAPAGFDIRRDPGFIPVAQLGYLLGRSIPAAAGPHQPLTNPHDDASDRPAEEQAGIRLLLEKLEESKETVVLSLVGSARVLSAAWNRNPRLVRAKTRAVLLNAGSTGGVKREWNVGLDPEAYTALWNAGLPLHWYPCSTERGAFNPDHERGTYWKTSHAAIFRGLSPRMRSWFFYALSASTRSDLIGALAEEPDAHAWEALLAQPRNMWATASLVAASGRVLAQTNDGWRFIPAHQAGQGTVWPFRLDPIDASVDAAAAVTWSPARHKGNALLFGRERRPGFGDAMAEALGALLGSLG